MAVLLLAGSPAGEGPASKNFQVFILRWMEGLIPAGCNKGFRRLQDGPEGGRVVDLAELLGICSRLDALVEIKHLLPGES